MNDALRWLHLSDLHLGCPGREHWWQAHDELPESLREGVRRHGAPDLVLFTGDLTFFGSEDEIGLVDAFLDELLGWIRDADAAADPVLVPVPGNRPALSPLRPIGTALDSEGFQSLVEVEPARTVRVASTPLQAASD